MQVLKDVVPAAQNKVNTRFIVVEKGRTRMEGQNKICVALVADKTAAVHLQLWGEECEAFEAGDIVGLRNGIFSYNHNNHLVLRAGKKGFIHKLGCFTMEFVETPNLSEIRWVLDPHSNCYVQAHLLSPHSRIFPPIP